MRLFCAIEIPAGIKTRLLALVDRLRPLAKLSWTRAENLHVTTKFIGEWPEQRLEEMHRALAGVPPSGPVEIAVRGLGWFPNERKPRVFWAGIESGQALTNLARETDRCVAALGVPVEEREFRPHLTLARNGGFRRGEPVPIDRLRSEVAANSSSDFGVFSAESFFLYLSKGGQYTKLREFPLV